MIAVTKAMLYSFLLIYFYRWCYCRHSRSRRPRRCRFFGRKVRSAVQERRG